MINEDLKTYSLKAALQIIQDETGNKLSESNLLRYACNKTLKISIQDLENRELRYIQLDRYGDNCKIEYCDILTKNDPKYVVYSSNHITTINPADETVFPLLGYNQLQDFITGKEATAIKSDRCEALDRKGNTLQISIVEGKWSTNPELSKWLKERNITDQYYYETSPRIKINKTNLCIIYLELSQFIEYLEFKAISEKSGANKMPNLCFDSYTLEKALIKIASYNNEFTKIEDIYQLVRQGDIQLCLHKPEWNYVQIDKKGHELDEVYCKPLGKYVLIPKDKKTTGLKTASFFAGNTLPQYHGVNNDVYPIVKSEYIIEMNDRGDDRLFIWDSHLLAKHKGEEIALARVKLTYFPVKDNSGNVDFKRLDNLYEFFMGWLEAEYPLIFNDYKNYCPNPLSNKYPFDEPRFFSTDFDSHATTEESRDKRQVFLKANREDLRITNYELERFIQTSKNLISNDILKSTHVQATEEEPKLAPAQEQNNYYETLTPEQKAKIKVIIQAHENLGIKAKKKDIYNECQRIKPDVINEKFKSFESNTWITLNKSGRNPKLNSPP